MTLAPNEPLSLATGSIWVSVPLMMASPVASLVMRQVMPVESLGTLLAGMVTSTTSASVFWMVATVPVQTEPTVASSAVMVPSIVAVRVQSSNVLRSVSRLSGVRWACSSLVALSSTFWVLFSRLE